MTFEKYVEITNANLPEDFEFEYHEIDEEAHERAWLITITNKNSRRGAGGMLLQEWLDLAFEEQIVENLQEIVSALRSVDEQSIRN